MTKYEERASILDSIRESIDGLEAVGVFECEHILTAMQVVYDDMLQSSNNDEHRNNDCW